MWWMLALSMAACAGLAAAPPVKDPRPVIVAFGDSLTDGYGVAAGQKYTDYLQTELDKAGYKYRVVNAGVSGDTTANALDRVASVLAVKPALVILEIGGNDGLRGLPIDQTRRNLEEIIGRLQAGGTKVVMWGMTLPKNYGAAYVKPYEAMFRAVAQAKKVPLIPVREEMGRIEADRRLMQPDGIHPTGAGYAQIAPVVFRYVRPELKKG